MDVFVQGKQLFALMDSESLLRYVNEKTAKSLHLSIYPLTHNASLTVGSLQESVFGHCVVELTLNGIRYQGETLELMKILCSDVLLGQDFQRQHERVVFVYDGTIPELVVSSQRRETCSNCGMSSTVQLSYVRLASCMRDVSSL